jgi:hypothetical protein
MGFMGYASFLDSSKHAMASARYFGRVIWCQDSFAQIRQRSAE